MTDGYWNHRHQQQHPLLQSGESLKRHRPEYDIASSGLPSSHEIHNYYPRDDDRERYQAVKDSKTIGSAYDRYLQNAQIAPLSSGEASGLSVGFGRASGGGMTGLPILDSGMARRARPSGQDLASNGRDIGFVSQPPANKIARPVRETVPLPQDASSTLYVEGLPPGSKRREVAHIFRPFVGYKEVRLVSKESKNRTRDPIILCFVDFDDAACAATAMSALQGSSLLFFSYRRLFLKSSYSNETKKATYIYLPLWRK
ncbi:RNA-binding protein 2 isoform X3 [Ricinus communis]|uniref:RNA-binding protein 2 isoform X3 n=1 Tax=Ricinus communis TaxID=3988 RepID=UPI00201AE704|nr:RNA-binding protein 2 isoform X3 [Ricinus communis]